MLFIYFSKPFVIQDKPIVSLRCSLALDEFGRFPPVAQLELQVILFLELSKSFLNILVSKKPKTITKHRSNLLNAQHEWIKGNIFRSDLGI